MRRAPGRAGPILWGALLAVVVLTVEMPAAAAVPAGPAHARTFGPPYPAVPAAVNQSLALGCGSSSVPYPLAFLASSGTAGYQGIASSRACGPSWNGSYRGVWATGYLNLTLTGRTAFRQVVSNWTVAVAGRTAVVLGNCTLNLTYAACAAVAEAYVFVWGEIVDRTNGSVYSELTAPPASDVGSVVQLGENCYYGSCFGTTSPTLNGSFFENRSVSLTVRLPSFVPSHRYEIVEGIDVGTVADCEVQFGTITGCRATATTVATGPGYGIALDGIVVA